ncbi:hypothetical protein AB205_0134530 [Aquarana catesbeiana]|uniref:Uncharacterized protein n=1 Tax=Aquarana catesbeiana TaxID=8400 RepID=A0A2G9NQQ8_AQUCT|nr:hypothetical protein AB205_0134530 [Aquarana catesbeiana]
MLANNYERSNVLDVQGSFSITNASLQDQSLLLPSMCVCILDFCPMDLCTHDRKVRQQTFVGGKSENMLANICWWKVRQQLSNGAYTRSDFSANNLTSNISRQKVRLCVRGFRSSLATKHSCTRFCTVLVNQPHSH